MPVYLRKSFDQWKLTLIFSPYKPELSMIRSCPDRLEFKNERWRSFMHDEFGCTDDIGLDSQGLAVIFSHHQVCVKKKKGGHFLGGSKVNMHKTSSPLSFSRVCLCSSSVCTFVKLISLQTSILTTDSDLSQDAFQPSQYSFTFLATCTSIHDEFGCTDNMYYRFLKTTFCKYRIFIVCQ
jgi:hypothetical protein